MRDGVPPGLERATIGVITALPKECAAVETVFGPVTAEAVEGRGGGFSYSVARSPSTYGGEHVVAIALLPDLGISSAAARATMLLGHCPNVRHMIMVGIAGAVPNPTKPEHHVRLGDIVVSDRNGVVQYRFVKMNSEAEELRSPPRPPGAVLTDAVRSLQKGEVLKQRPWEAYIRRAIKTIGAAARRPPQTKDQLHDWNDGRPAIPHPLDRLRRRGVPRVFLGPIASADVLLKDPGARNRLRDQCGVKAVEMEGGGIADATWLDEAGYLVIRGTCDYCNKDKGDEWQLYAAIVAAAYARSVIEQMPAEPLGQVTHASITPGHKTRTSNAIALVQSGDDQKGPPFETMIAPKLRVLPEGQQVLIGNLRFAWIRGGTFPMGSDDGYPHERPRHPVRVSSFFLAVTPTTNEQFDSFVHDTNYITTAEIGGVALCLRNGLPDAVPGAQWRRPRGPASTIGAKQRHPVVAVSWADAVEFCRWLSAKYGFEFSLPTEAQWEYAAAGRQGRIWAYGNEYSARKANVEGSGTSPVAGYQPNESGLWDMTGNVYQWCADWFSKTWQDAGHNIGGAPVRDPTGAPTGSHRVLRGGSWFDNAWHCRCANRLRGDPRVGSDNWGFRCALAISDELILALRSSGWNLSVRQMLTDLFEDEYG